MDIKRVWSGSFTFKGVAVVAIASLLLGLAISGSFDWLAPSRAVNTGRRCKLRHSNRQSVARFRRAFEKDETRGR